jgi:uncharacterized phage protein gp47/JayE
LTTVAVGDSAYPTPDEIRDILLRTIVYAYAQRGLTANVGVGSDHYIRSSVYAGRISIAIANNKIALSDMSPLTATGDNLTTLAGVYGVIRRPAASAAGPVVIKCTGTVVIPAGFQCTSPSGHKYKTVALATLTNGQSVEVIAVEAGASTNIGAGTRLTWDSATIGNLDPIATVGTGGLEGGAEADNDDRLRERLLLKLAFPGVGGNWSQVVDWAEESTSSVEAAYCYPAVRGPGSYDVVVTKVGGDRSLGPTTIGIVTNYIAARMPGQNDLNVTSVTAEYVDVIIEADLPLPQSVGGAGGGWLDPAPWPSETVKVTSYNSSTGVATCNATVSPVVSNRIAIWDPDAVDAAGNSAPRMREYTITSVGGVSGAYTFAVQGGFGFTPTNAYVSAGAVHMAEYGQDLLAQFALLGPGEKSNAPEVVPRGRRQPSTDVQAPSAISNNLLAKVVNAHSEIEDLAYAARYATGTTTPLTGPSIPLTPADPANIIVLKYLALHP